MLLEAVSVSAAGSGVAGVGAPARIEQRDP
jgi:hypothetical protein